MEENRPTKEYFVTISKKWKQPINTFICLDKGTGIDLSIKLGDFITLLKDEIGSPTFRFSKETLSKDIDKAVTDILEGIKNESRKVMV